MHTFTERRGALAAVAMLALIGGCATGSAPSDSVEIANSVEPVPSASEPSVPSTEPTATASPEPTPVACAATTSDDAACQVVPARANIFGAGREVAPNPAGGGGGVLPPMWEVPEGARTLAVTNVLGEVRPVRELAPNGPEGRGGPTNLNSWEGISGILHEARSMFLVGVFLTDAEPAGDAPERLDFTGREHYDELAPEIGQTFLIGDGEGRTVIVPEGATRLFLGFADGYVFVGLPGWYDNNSGQLAVTVAFGE